jgi:transposase
MSPGKTRPEPSDDIVEAVVVKTLAELSRHATQWSTRSMAVGMSQSAISGSWRAFALKPHPVDSLKLSTDPQFIEKVRDVVGLYVNPPQAALVLCVDEKTQVQALDLTAPALSMGPGVPARQTHDYVGGDTTNLSAALDVASGKMIAEMAERYRADEFHRFLNLIDRSAPAELDVYVIVDNSSTHKTPEVHTWLVRHPRYHQHFTPAYSSWLNLVERWFAELTNKWLRRAAHRSTNEMEAAIGSWVTTWNEDPQALRMAQDRRRDPGDARCLFISAALTQDTSASSHLVCSRGA